jgi:hypothetical protein
MSGPEPLKPGAAYANRHFHIKGRTLSPPPVRCRVAGLNPLAGAGGRWRGGGIAIILLC